MAAETKREPLKDNEKAYLRDLANAGARHGIKPGEALLLFGLSTRLIVEHRAMTEGVTKDDARYSEIAQSAFDVVIEGFTANIEPTQTRRA